MSYFLATTTKLSDQVKMKEMEVKGVTLLKRDWWSRDMQLRELLRKSRKGIWTRVRVFEGLCCCGIKVADLGI